MGNELSNIKIDATFDGNQAIAQIGTFLECIPKLGNWVAEQKYRNKIKDALCSKHAKLIEEGKATIDENGKIIIFDELNPIQRSKAISLAREQHNENVITELILEELKDKNPDDFVRSEDTKYSDEEFIPHWQDGFRYMNREDLQRLWARMFVQEMQHPNSVSIRTMKFIETLSKKDAEIFNKILPYVIGNSAIPYIYNIVNGMDLKHLEYLGLLLNNILKIITSTELLSNKYALSVEKEIKFSVYKLSDVGKELYSVANTKEELDFDKLEEVYDNDYRIKVGDKISFHHKTSPTEYNKDPFRIYEKKEEKDTMHKYRDIPRLS